MTVAIKQACENRGGQAGSSPLISLSLSINLDLDLNGSTDEERRELWRIARAGLFYATRLKVMPYHIWHPKAWDIDPAVWPLIGLGFEHQLGPSVEGRVRSGMCDRLSSFVMGIDDLPPWGRLARQVTAGTAWVIFVYVPLTCHLLPFILIHLFHNPCVKLCLKSHLECLH